MCHCCRPHHTATVTLSLCWQEYITCSLYLVHVFLAREGHMAGRKGGQYIPQHTVPMRCTCTPYPADCCLPHHVPQSLAPVPVSHNHQPPHLSGMTRSCWSTDAAAAAAAAALIADSSAAGAAAGPSTAPPPSSARTAAAATATAALISSAGRTSTPPATCAGAAGAVAATAAACSARGTAAPATSAGDSH